MTSPITARRGRLAFQRLLRWYARHGRHLPWRGRPADPYRAWLAEIMLQQTSVTTVQNRFTDFLRRFPTATHLAHAPVTAVRTAWAGLGYYARANNLHRAAQRIEQAGFPTDVAGWRALPGVGAYTAAALAAIVNGQPTVPIDTNLRRVLARLLGDDGARRGLDERLQQAVLGWLPRGRAGDVAEALMDLGSLVCTPRAPRCALCPLRQDCVATGDDPQRFPQPVRKPSRPVRQAAMFVLYNKSGGVWLVRRPARGLLPGMASLPGTAWQETVSAAAIREARPAEVRWRALPGMVRHPFTHFLLQITVYTATIAGNPMGDGWWQAARTLPQAGLPTVMRKVLAHAHAAVAVVDTGGRRGARR